jgi:hypothetical protein
MHLLSSSPSTPQYSYSLSGTPTSQHFAISNQSDSPLDLTNFASPIQDQAFSPPTDASIQSEDNAVARQSYQLETQKSSLQMANSSHLYHGRKRDASFLDSEPSRATTQNARCQQDSKAAPSGSTSAIAIKSRQSSSDASPKDAPEASEINMAAARTRTTDSAKVRHNIVERRYRENINAQVDLLRESIVATVHSKEDQQGRPASLLGADELKRLTKAAVIAAATKHIRRARTENERLLDEHRSLQAQIQELESLVKCADCPLMKLTVDLSLENPTCPP